MTLGNDNGTGRTDRQTDRQTECDAICGPLLGPHNNMTLSVCSKHTLGPPMSSLSASNITARSLQRRCAAIVHVLYRHIGVASGARRRFDVHQVNL